MIFSFELLVVTPHRVKVPGYNGSELREMPLEYTHYEYRSMWLGHNFKNRLFKAKPGTGLMMPRTSQRALKSLFAEIWEYDETTDYKYAFV